LTSLAKSVASSVVQYFFRRLSIIFYSGILAIVEN